MPTRTTSVILSKTLMLFLAENERHSSELHIYNSQNIFPDISLSYVRAHHEKLRSSPFADQLVANRIPIKTRRIIPLEKNT